MKKINLMKGAAIAALFSLVALLGCNNNAAGAGNYSATGQIFGYVTDTKGEPLSGVTIALGNQTTTTNENGAFALTGVPANATQNANGGITEATTTTTAGQKYVLTATKDGYLSSKMEDIYVVETTDKSDAALLLNTAATAYATILNTFAGVGGTGATAIAAGTTIAADGLILDTQNTNDTFKGMADAYATILDRYANLSKTYESTFVTTTLTPCNAYVEGSLKITKSPQKNITTDAASIKAAPADVKVKLVGGSGTTKYVYEAKTDSNGKFKFEKLPVNTELTLKVEGFEATYESGEGENKVVETYYYSLTDGAGATANLYDGEELQENVLTFTLEENSGAKYKADILLYSQPAKIIATATNLLESTKVAPLALNTPVTVTFNKPMDYVTLGDGTTVSDSGDKATYAWDEKKTTVTITPKDGYWTASTTTATTATFALAGRAQDGATSFIDNSFTVTLDNVIKVVFADTSDATADKFTLTFDRELVKTDAVKVTDDKSEALDLSWDKTNAAAPVLTVKARDGKFANAGDHIFTITGVEAKDQSTTISSYSREFVAFTAATNTTTANTTFKTRFDGFKPTGIEVVDKAEGALSRAVVATTAQYLKINFNKNVGDVTGLGVYDSNTAGATAITASKYVKDNAVYISLSNFEDNKPLYVKGKVYSTAGDEFNGDAANADVTWTKLLTDYKVRTAYVIAASNLYVENSSINTNNDKTTNAIKSGEKVTLTFNKEIPANATIETELYRSDSVVAKDLTAYTATATASGKVVTVTLSETLPGKTYYLSLKIKSADGAELFSTGSKSFATGTYVKDVYVENQIKATVSSKNYIKVDVLAVALLPEGSSKTTKAADFKKVFNGTIVLQFNQDVTGYTAFLYDGSQATRDILAANPTDLTKPANFVNLGNNEKKFFYGATATVSGDTITIVPAGSFASDATPGIVVYDNEGNWVELGTATTKNVGGTTVNTYTPYAPYKAKHYTTKLNPDNATKLAGFKLTAAKESGYATTEGPEFTFDMFAANKYTDDLPTFTLYKKVNYGYGDVEWEQVSGTITITKDDKTTPYTYSLLRDKAKGYFKPALTVGDEINNGEEIFVVLTTVNNMIVRSEEIKITK